MAVPRRFNKHDFLLMTTPQGEEVEVDTDIAPLIAQFWKAGINTRFSCQGSPKFVDQTEWDAKRWLAYVMLELDENSMEFINSLMSRTHFFLAEKVSWAIEFDRGSGDDDKNRVTLRFPHQDIVPLTSYLMSWNDADQFVLDLSSALDRAEIKAIEESLGEN